MHYIIPFSLFLTLLDVAVYPANAIKLPFRVRTTTGHSLHRRADITGQVTGNSTVPIANTHNAEYISNITLGGQSIPVMLDTGSSDLWVTGTVSGAKDLGKAATLSYAVGQASGDINTAILTFDEYTVTDQAFLLVTNTSSFSTDITAQGYAGLVGLGPNTGSIIRDKVGNAAGDSMLNRIFQQNQSSQNYITFLLDRLGDPGEPFKGQFTISEPVPGFENITSQPKLDIDILNKLTDSDQHWQILTDKDNGIIGPDGQPIQIKSIVPKAPSGQLVAVIDSGYTLPQVPRKVSDAIYGRVQGAVYDSQSGVWTIPCSQLINLSFNFGGVNFPIHPLDVSSSDFNTTDSNGNPVCIGLFQPITSAFSLLGEYDLILGMGFLRNAYTLLDYGNFVDGSSNDRNQPYIQMLPLTNVNSAHNDFVQVRLNGQDTTGDSAHALLPPDQGQQSPETSDEKKKEAEEKVLSRWPYILIGCLVFIVLVVGLCIWRCCCRRSKKTKGGIIPSSVGAKTLYQPIQDPTPMQRIGGSYSGDDHYGGGGKYEETSYSGGLH